MRSRFEAFRDGDAEWLLASWHHSTRPASLDLTRNPRWRGLQIVDTVAGTAADDTGIVEFRATYFSPPDPQARHDRDLQVLHERSRFVREAGRWYYVDAIGTVL
jgi:SEC-C motif domain protein